MRIQRFTTYNKKTKRISLALLMGVLGSVSLFSSAIADSEYTIKSGDSLSKIVSKNYPDIKRKDYKTIMTQIVEDNPSAFANKGFNSLRVGKTLTLADQNKKEGETETASPKKESSADDSSKEKSKSEKAKDTDTKEKPELDVATEIANQLKAAQKESLEEDKPDSDTKKDDEVKATQKVEELTAEVEQLRTLVEKYEKEQSATPVAEDNDKSNSELEDLQTENEQLKGLVKKYEAESQESNADSSGEGQAGNKSSEDFQTEIDQLQMLVKKYEAEKEELAQNTTSSEGSGSGQNQAEFSALQAELETLKQDNKQLQAEIANTSVNGSKVSYEASLINSFWEKFSWVLPLLGILIGLFLLIALIKRIRDKRATQELKVALSTSSEPSANTAAAFSVDGSMLPTASTVDDAPIEEDSVEAGVKIDMAKAYLDLDDIEAAQELLQEAVVEGSSAQRATAEKLLRKTTQ